MNAGGQNPDQRSPLGIPLPLVTRGEGRQERVLAGLSSTPTEPG